MVVSPQRVAACREGKFCYHTIIPGMVTHEDSRSILNNTVCLFTAYCVVCYIKIAVSRDCRICDLKVLDSDEGGHVLQLKSADGLKILTEP